MKIDEFDRRVKFSLMNASGKTVKAARLVLVDGYSRSDASKKLDMSLSVVSRGVKRIKEVKLEGVCCPECGNIFNV
jgi:DNA-binding transcriptional regulator LsrR (DeoR family)